MENPIDPKFLQHLTCKFCSKIATDAVENDCCHNVYCNSCLTNAKSSNKACSSCQKSNYKIVPAHFAQRLINTLSIECSYGCGTTISRGELGDHQKKCLKRVYTCSRSTCSFKGNEESYKAHIIKDHSDYLIQAFDALEQGKKFSKKGTVKGSYKFEGEDHEIQGEYRLDNGKLTIDTVDDVGPAEWRGHVDMKNLVVKIIKTYVGAHSVEYNGRINEGLTEIKGTWNIQDPYGRYGDEFQLTLH